MYHLILVATLFISHTVKEIPSTYYESKAECYNQIALAPSNLVFQQSVCRMIEDEWFPDKDAAKSCRDSIDNVQSVSAKCVRE